MCVHEKIYCRAEMREVMQSYWVSLGCSQSAVKFFLFHEYTYTLVAQLLFHGANKEPRG